MENRYNVLCELCKCEFSYYQFLEKPRCPRCLNESIYPFEPNKGFLPHTEPPYTQEPEPIAEIIFKTGNQQLVTDKELTIVVLINPCSDEPDINKFSGTVVYSKINIIIPGTYLSKIYKEDFIPVTGKFLFYA